MKIAFLGLTITSSWGNGHATTYRALIKALAGRGHQIVFFEKDAEWYRQNRDLPHPEYCTVMLYSNYQDYRAAILKEAATADIIVIGSYYPDAIEATEDMVEQQGPIIFYDIDTPVTFAGLRSEGGTSYLRASAVPCYSAYLSFSGGPVLEALESEFGSPLAVPFYCSVDTDLYRRVSSQPELRADLGYLGTYAVDRQPKLLELLAETSRFLPEQSFLVAGPMYPAETRWGPNVRYLPHIAPSDHPGFYSSSRFTLNLTRADMVAFGYSPSVRLFEAAACSTAIISDSWSGLDQFLKPGQEILLASDRYDVTNYLCDVGEDQAQKIGEAARDRILAEHTAEHRALQFETIVERIFSGEKHSNQTLTIPTPASKETGEMSTR